MNLTYTKTIKLHRLQVNTWWALYLRWIMKFNAIIKPEGTMLTSSMKSFFRDHRFSKQLLPLSKGIERLRTNSLLDNEITKEVELVRKGIFTEEILKLLYEDYYLNDNETFQRIATRYLGQPFWAFEVEIDSPASEVYALMDSVKGRMSNLSPENATGLRGHLLRERVSRNAKIYGKEGWKDTGNFIHFPDNEIETKRCGKALRLDLKSPFEIWDTYKLFDRDIFLDKRRTVADVEHICQDFPVEKFPTVLDLGCGNGRISRALSEHGYQVFGVDFDGLETEYCEEFDI